MNRRALLLAAGCLACGAGPTRRPFFDAALRVARDAGAVDAKLESFVFGELTHLTKLARPAVSSSGASAASELNALIFERLGFVREVEDPDLRFVLLPQVLRDRRGSCVGLGVLYLALAEALNLDAHGVLRPGHFYVRLGRTGAHTNVELLRRGEAMPDSWYEARFPVPGGAARAYARPLTQDETMAVVEYNVGNERRREHRIEDARRAYSRAVRRFPEFAEAHASLGATLQLLGRLEEAAASYHAAERANPQLPRLDRNLNLLERERAL